MKKMCPGILPAFRKEGSTEVLTCQGLVGRVSAGCLHPNIKQIVLKKEKAPYEEVSRTYTGWRGRGQDSVTSVGCGPAILPALNQHNPGNRDQLVTRAGCL